MQIPWLFPIFIFSLTFNKIPWLFPDFCQVWNFPDFSLTAGHPVVVEPPLAAGPAPAEPSATGRAPAEPSATGAGTGTAGADSIWICRTGEATTVIVRFSWVLDFGGDSWNSRLTTNVQPVLSELSRHLSWWWREEELDGRVSDVFETLPDSARLRELDPPEELGRSRSLSLRSLLWPSRRDDWCLGDSPCAQASATCGGPTRGSWAVPPPRRWKPRTWVAMNSRLS